MLLIRGLAYKAILEEGEDEGAAAAAAIGDGWDSCVF